MRITILGLSITSSWGNGHATTYRGLVRELVRRGHEVLFLERDVPWYADNRDLPEPPFGRTQLYSSLSELKRSFARAVRRSDAVMVGSYVPQGVRVGQWVLSLAEGVTAFYDIDTPVTLAKLARKDHEYITPELISQYDLYLSFTGGPTLRHIEREFGSPRARALYCSVDPKLYYPERRKIRWDLGYLGTYSQDRQPPLEKLMLRPAAQAKSARFVVAGPMYPQEIDWPGNVERITHLPPSKHRAFYNAQRFTLNITRADMVRAGWSPSVRIFEAAACGVPMISDYWDGLGDLLKIGKEILVSRGPQDTLRCLHDLTDQEGRAIGKAARSRVLSAHTAAHRAAELEAYLIEVRAAPPGAAKRGTLTASSPGAKRKPTLLKAER